MVPEVTMLAWQPHDKECTEIVRPEPSCMNRRTILLIATAFAAISAPPALFQLPGGTRVAIALPTPCIKDGADA